MAAPALSAASDLGAFCAHEPLRRAGARVGPLAGLSFAVKDVFSIAGVRACYGNPTWLRTHPAAKRTASAIEKLCGAGASLVGLTITDELALSLTGENAHFGTPVNPRCPGRVPGGSSSGSAVAVASGQVDFALGTDTGGSVRVPASHTGVFGFRPSHGAVQIDGVLPLAPRFDTVGWFTRDAELLERVGQILLPARAETSRPELPLELAVWPELLSLLDEPARAAFVAAAHGLSRAVGAPLVFEEVPSGFPPPASWLEFYLTLQNLEAQVLHRPFIERERPTFGSLIGRRWRKVLTTNPALAGDAELGRDALRGALARVFGARTWIVLPSAPGAAPLLGESDDAVDAFTGRALTLAALASLGGAPQMSVPLAASEGCPLGVSLVAPPGQDRALLSAAVRASRALVLPENHS
jgi:amidase